MKPRTLISVFTLALAASSSACTAETQPQQSAGEQTAKTDEAQLIANTGTILAWPAGPIAWNGLAGTWPISVWSPAAIGALAFDVAGVTNLGVTCATFPGLLATTISTPLLNAFVPPVGAAPLFGGAGLFGPAGLIAPAFGFTGSFAPFAAPLGFGFGAFTPTAALTGTFANGAFAPGFASAWFTPALTANALVFSNLTAINAFTPFTFNVTFMAQSAAQAAAITQASAISTSSALATAGLSIFATPIATTALAAQTAAIPFTSIIFPILLPLPALGAAPLVGAPLAAGTLL